MKRRDFLIQTALGAGAFSVQGCLGLNRSKKQPNFVIIFTDDQGYADVGCYGAKDFTTPNLDQMAREGMSFTNFYVSQAVCSASRASLLTGCYSNRVGIYGALMPNAKVGLNPEEQTIAELLKEKGYATGIFGKWHLGHHREFLPLQHGFDEYLGLPYSNDMWAVDFDGTRLTEEYQGSRAWKLNYPPLALIDGNDKTDEIWTLEDQATLTTRYTERAVKFIEKNKHRPFFLYLPHSMPHVPLGVSKKFRGKSKQGLYGDVIMEIDWSVGQILQTLKNQGLDDNTLVIFASDNGPWLNFGNHAGSAKPLREGKGTSWEGGPRVPCIMRWPGRINAGTVCSKMAATIDLLPTIAAISGSPLPLKKIDGVNILALLEGEKNANPRNLYFFYYGKQLRGVRQGKWKLTFPHEYRSYQGLEPGKDGFPGPTKRRKTDLQLFDLDNDISETIDVASQYQDVVKRLEILAEKSREDIGDSLHEMEGKNVRPARNFLDS
jgi:arylsulfatase A-like enzyme